MAPLCIADPPYPPSVAERIAELSALGLDPQATIRGLTEAVREVLK